MADLDDPERLALIGRSYYDLSSDATLDSLLEEAVKVADVPMAMVSIVGAFTQVYRAHRGLPPELAIACGTSRSSSFCQLVVRSENALVVTDAVTDPRIPQELVATYGVRAYAGVPIRRRGVVLGSVCVVDIRPHVFSNSVLVRLSEIAAQVSGHLEEEERRARPTGTPKTVAVHDLRERAETILAALSIIETSAQHAQHLDRTDITESVLEAVRSVIAEVLGLHSELERTGAELEAMITASDVGQEVPDLQREASAILRSLAEVAVMARVVDAFARGELDGRSAARALSVSRDVLFAVDTLIHVSRSMIASLDVIERRAIVGMQ